MGTRGQDAVGRRSSWGDLVFHVLAHVEPTAPMPASVYDPRYVRFAQDALGPAASRELGADIDRLRGVYPDHARFAAAQRLAWLFEDVAQAECCAALPLSELRASDVADTAALAAVRAQLPAVEVLRCAALLEAPHHARLPPAPVADAVVREALTPMQELAPRLKDCELCCVRALTRHGRLVDRAIWVGNPLAQPGPSLEHVCWQAAHEASVLEVRARSAALNEREAEYVALALLQHRADGAGRRDAHRRWLRTWSADGIIPSLSVRAEAVLRGCLG